MSKSPPAEQPTFEATFEKLSTIVDKLEDGDLPLADALSQYEQGIAAYRQCRETLEQAERKLELLTGVDAAGNPITQPFAESGGELQEQAGNRTRRKSRTKSESSTDDDGQIPY